MPPTVSSLLRFAEFEVDLRAGQLRKNGKIVRLQEQPFRVLEVLLESPGALLTREELRSRLWPADTFVDFDHRLAVAISKLRDALKDSAENPMFIETVGRRGYRFMLRVEQVAPARLPNDQTQAMAETTTAAALPSRKFTPLLVPLLGTAFALLLLISVVLIRRWRSADSAPSNAAQISSIAVLPLENLSNDPNQEYFVEGMTDEIITDLAKLPGIRVISRTSAMQYRGTHKTMPAIARELKVEGVLEGSVLRVGNRVRIRTQLIYAPTDRHVWAQAYERDLKDVLSMQANLAQDIASEIQLKLTSQQQAQLRAPGNAVDPEAHELYLQGRFFWNRRNPSGFAKAIDYFQQAINKDPNYAEAYAGLADVYALSSGLNLVSVSNAMPDAKAAAEHALHLDPHLAEAHASLGLIAPFLDWNWSEAEEHYERAIDLNPNYATAHHWYAEGYLIPMGRVDDALFQIRKAQELDPLSAVISTDLGKELFFARRYDEAIAQLRRALEVDPNFTSAHNWISDCLLEKRDYPAALVELEKTKPSREERVYLRQMAYLHARMGKRVEAEAELAKALELSRGKSVSSGAVALTYAALGDRDKAFEWLQRAADEKSSFMTCLRYWSVFDPLRSDPRYADLLKQVRLSR